MLDSARFKLLTCGRRWGKSSTGLLAVLKGHGEYRGQRLGAIDGGNIYWVAPIIKQANRIWDQLKRATRDVWIEKSETYREIGLPGGGRVCVRSADDPDSLRGDGLDGVVLDEGFFMKPDIWHKVLRPALSDRLGWAMFASSPNGFNWGKDLWDHSVRLPDWGRWQCPTWDNPVISPQEILEAKATMSPTAFRQEYGAEFVQQEGAEWPGEYFAEHIWYDSDADVPTDIQCCVIAVDASKGKSDKSDFSAFVTVRLDGRGVAWIDPHIERCDVTQIASKSVALCGHNRPHGIGFEINSFQELIATEFVRQCHHASVDVMQYGITNTANKIVRIRTLGPWLSSRRVRIKRSLGGILLVEQLREFPLPNAHDDGPDAMEMGLRLVSQMCSDRKTKV